MEEMSMEKALGFVLELESQAQEILADATTRRDSLHDSVEKKLAEMRERYLGEADKRLSVIRAEESAALGTELDTLRRESELQLKRLESAARLNSEKWAERIFRRVTGAAQPENPEV